MTKYSQCRTIIILLITVSFFSCKKFLDIKPTSTLTTENAFISANDIEAALVGAYNPLIGTNYYQWEMIAHTDVRSDNAYCGGSNDVDYYQLDLNIIPTTNGSVYRAWKELYGGIAAANVVLANVGNIQDKQLTELRRKQIIGEACFLRAFHYFQLVTLFGEVPLVKASESASLPKLQIPKSPVTDVYNFIDSNLQIAAHSVPDSYSGSNTDKVRITKGAAFSLLAKTWAQRPDRDYNKVSAYCDSVINGGGNYSLLANYDNLFDGAHNYNTESILEIAFAPNTPQGNWGTEMLYPTHNDDGSVPGDTWQRYAVPSKTLVKAFNDDGDIVRKNSTVSFEVAPWGDDYWNPCGNAAVRIPFAYKHRNPNNWSGGDHTYLIRLADIVLLKAEALANTGDITGGLSFLNQVRVRANVQPINNASQASLKLLVLRERQLELAYEGQRWNDLNRFGNTVTYMNGLNEVRYTCNNGNASDPVPVNYNFNQNKTVLPIPSLELQANPNLKQNPGY